MATFIKPCYGYLNSLVGLRTDPKTGKVNANHQGVDYTSHANNDIYASAAGKVRFLDNSKDRTGFGRYLIITHDNGYETLYAHLASINVKLNQRVSQGQKVGVKGTTGKSTGVHLHFEMSKGRWNNQYTTNLNPIVLIDDPEIRVLQSVLKELGIYKGAVDGKHGDASIAAVEAFQKINGMGADGVPGRGTMAAIFKEKERIESIVKPAIPKPVPKEEEVKVANTDEKNAKPSPSLIPEFNQAVKAGITDGTYPNRPATRAEVAVMVLRGVGKIRAEKS